MDRARTTVNPFYVQEIPRNVKKRNIPVFVNPIHPDLAMETWRRLRKII